MSSAILFSPYGHVSRESGLLFLFASYLNRDRGVGVVELRCTGSFPRCYRDSFRRGERGIHSCLSCQAEARSLAQWAGIDSRSVGAFIEPGDVEALRRSILQGHDLPIELLAISEQAAQAHREGRERKNQLDFSVALQTIAFKRAINVMKPQFVLLAGGRDELTAPAALVSARAGVRAITFQWNEVTRVVHLSEIGTQRAFVTPLVIDQLPQARRESWSSELVRSLGDLSDWLGVHAALAQAV